MEIFTTTTNSVRYLQPNEEMDVLKELTMFSDIYLLFSCTNTLSYNKKRQFLSSLKNIAFKIDATPASALFSSIGTEDVIILSASVAKNMYLLS